MIAGKTLYHMNENQQPALCFFVVGLIGLGVISLVVGGFVGMATCTGLGTGTSRYRIRDWRADGFARHRIVISSQPGVVRPNSICLPFSVGLVESAWGRCGSRNRSDMAWAR